MDLKSHWENIYFTKPENQFSWYEDYPVLSMKYLKEKNLSKDAAIIDVGGGQSRLAETLIGEGFTNVTVLDISSQAIENNKKRLGDKAKKVNWIVSDITEFASDKKFDFWHDRAVLHFLTTDELVNQYIQKANNYIAKNGTVTIGTFSESGPEKCSGIEIRQYSESKMEKLFSPYFEKDYCEEQIHKTPSEKIQNFVFCNFTHK